MVCAKVNIRDPQSPRDEGGFFRGHGRRLMTGTFDPLSYLSKELIAAQDLTYFGLLKCCLRKRRFLQF